MSDHELQRLIKFFNQQHERGNELMVILSLEHMVEELCTQIVTNSTQQELRDMAVAVLSALKHGN